MQQLQQCALVDRELLQWLALDARHDGSNKPARLAHLDNGDQRAVRIEGGEGSAQVVQLLHGALHRFRSAPMDALSSPPPHSIFLRDQLGGCLIRPEWHPACKRREARPGFRMERENLRSVTPTAWREKPRAAPTARARVPKRSAGAEQPVVVRKVL